MDDFWIVGWYIYFLGGFNCHFVFRLDEDLACATVDKITFVL